MKLKNYLVELLSNIIHDRLEELADIKNNIKQSEDYKKIEDLFSDVNNIVDVDNDELRKVLSSITDDETIDEIISNIDMIKIVVNGMNDGLDLSLDDSQKDLVRGVYDIVNNHREEIEEKNNKEKSYLEDFLSKCEQLSHEIGTGVVRNIDTLDEIFKENNVSLDDIVKAKFEILKNNSKNYNLQLDDKVKEEVKLRIILKKLDIDLESYTDIEKRILVSSGDAKNIEELVDYMVQNDIKLVSSNLFIILLLSNVSIFSNVCEISKKYDVELDKIFNLPGVFISAENKELLSNVINDNKDDEQFYIIGNLEYIGCYYERFVENISLLESNNISVNDCFNNNILSLIVPDMAKNITILSDLNLSNKDFSIVVINPYLATSISSFKECGLADYINSNPLRLTTSYYRLRQISSNIVFARKNGKIIFRSLSDKKNYWLAKDITRNSSEVI